MAYSSFPLKNSLCWHKTGLRTLTPFFSESEQPRFRTWPAIFPSRLLLLALAGPIIPLNWLVLMAVSRRVIDPKLIRDRLRANGRAKHSLLYSPGRSIKLRCVLKTALDHGWGCPAFEQLKYNGASKHQEKRQIFSLMEPALQDPNCCPVAWTKRGSDCVLHFYRAFRLKSFTNTGHRVPHCCTYPLLAPNFARFKLAQVRRLHELRTRSGGSVDIHLMSQWKDHDTSNSIIRSFRTIVLQLINDSVQTQVLGNLSGAQFECIWKWERKELAYLYCH